jgi:hypothetical protein
MRPNLLLLWVIIMVSLVRVGLVQGQTTPGISINAPADGDVLQGVVTISGMVQVEGFERGEVEFAYSHDAVDRGWFLIGEINQPIVDGPLATWDTTTITDGSYDLRVIAYSQGKDPVEIVVKGLRVRNYTQIETATPSPEPTRNGMAVPMPTAQEPGTVPLDSTPVVTLTVRPTPLPTNPAQMKPTEIIGGFGMGLISAAGLVGLLGLYVGFRSRKR